MSFTIFTTINTFIILVNLRLCLKLTEKMQTNLSKASKDPHTVGNLQPLLLSSSYSCFFVFCLRLITVYTFNLFMLLHATLICFTIVCHDINAPTARDLETCSHLPTPAELWIMKAFAHICSTITSRAARWCCCWYTGSYFRVFFFFFLILCRK